MTSSDRPVLARIFLLFYLLMSYPVSAGVETISLTRYLNAANEAGHNIVFSSALVRPHYRVTYDSENEITEEHLLRALSFYGLTITGNSGGYQVIRVRDIQAELDKPEPVFPLPIEEIVVNASQHDFALEHIGHDVYFDKENLAGRATPGNDVLRVVSKIPGSANDGVSARSAIRGGLADETLTMIDGVRLYKPFHLGGFNSLFSAIDRNTIDNFSFMTGGFPAKYGDRLSGVMLINSRSPVEMAPVRQLGVGLYTLSYLHKGNIGDSDFLASVRRSSVDLVSRAAKIDVGKPQFSDAFIRIDSTLSNTTTLSTNLLWFGDDVSINNSSHSEDAKSMYGNTNLWFNMSRKALSGRESTTRLGMTAIKDDRNGRINKPGIVNGELSDDQEFRFFYLEHEQTFQWGSNLIVAGGSYRYLDAEYGYSASLAIDEAFLGLSNYERPVNQQSSEQLYGQKSAVYFSIKRAIGDRLFVEAGIRVDAQDYIKDGWTEQTNPRLNLLYKPPVGGELRLSFGEFSQAQGIHELDISDGQNSFRSPQKSRHWVLSYDRSIGDIDLRIEAYRKQTDRTTFYFENLSDPISIVPELQADRFRVLPDDVNAYGVELSVNAWFEHSEIWFNYSRARVEEEVDGRTFRRSNDQKHSAKAGWSTRWSNWRLSVETTSHSGWPTSSLLLDDSGQAYRGQRNDRRLPNFVTADIKAVRTWMLPGSELKLELGVTNLLNRKNVVGTEYIFDEGQLVRKEQSALPIAPVVDLYWRF